MKQIFINLAVQDLQKATEFYEGLGFVKNSQFSDDHASSLGWSEHIIVMLLKHEFYAQFIKNKSIIDAHSQSEVLLSLSMDSKESVQSFADKAISLGGKVYDQPSQTQNDAMFGLSVEDLDGHIWEPVWMDLEKFSQTM